MYVYVYEVGLARSGAAEDGEASLYTYYLYNIYLIIYIHIYIYIERERESERERERERARDGYRPSSRASRPRCAAWTPSACRRGRRRSNRHLYRLGWWRGLGGNTRYLYFLKPEGFWSHHLRHGVAYLKTVESNIIIETYFKP